MKKYLRFEYFYIVLILIWEPLVVFILNVDRSRKSILFLTVVLVSLFLKKKKFLQIAFTKPNVIWGLWVIYAFSNTLYKGYYHGDLPMYSFFILIFVPYVFMTIIAYLSFYNRNRLINVLVFGMYIAIIIIMLFDKKDNDRLGVLVNANTIGMMSLILMMLLYLKYFYKSAPLFLLLSLSILPLGLMIKSGSRTAFGGFLLLILTHFIINRSKSFLISIVSTVFLISVLAFPLKYLLNNSKLGERIMSTTEQVNEKSSFKTDVPLLDKLGDRGIFYYVGWQVFKENPVTGIGLNNYKYYTDGVEEQHSEYMIQLAELGVVGSFLFLFFYFSIFKNLIDIKEKYKKPREVEIYIAYIIIILLMITVTRMYKVWYLFSIVGLVSGFIFKTNSLLKRKLQVFLKVDKT